MSNPVPRFTGKVVRGKIELEDSAMFNKYLCGFEGKMIEVSVRKYRKSISTPQIRYYYGVIVSMLGDYFGYDKDNMDWELKRMFLGEPDGNGLVKVPSKTVLDTGTAEDYFERIRQWASQEHGFYIPNPNEVLIDQ